MKLLASLTSMTADKLDARSEIRLKLIIIYLLGSGVALTANILLGPFGVDFTREQLRAFFLYFFPILSIPCLIVDIWLIIYFLRPIDAFFANAVQHAGNPDSRLLNQAFARAVNFPLITVLRVELVHFPLGLLGVLIPMYVFDLTGFLHFQPAQYASVIILGIINATIHSIVEYYLVSRFIKNVLEFLRDRFGKLDADPNSGVMFINTRLKFYFIYFFIAVMPIIFLGATLLFKTGRFFSETGLNHEFLYKELVPWTVLFILISSFASFIMAYILSREIIDPINALTDSMKKVEKGKFDEKLVVSTADEFSELFAGFNNMTEGLIERETIKRKFGKYVPERVLKDILASEPSLGGEEKTVTILFSDIRNYTGLSEAMSASETVEFLNQYFSEMVKVIEEHNGILDKFIGDAVMAVFGAPMEDENHAHNALAAAMEMLKRVGELNNTRVAENWPAIDIGIGISTGRVLVGNIGSESRMEYTVIGDTVNLASRLESLTKDTGRKILFSDSTYDRIKNDFPAVRIGSFEIKGRKLPCEVYSV